MTVAPPYSPKYRVLVRDPELTRIVPMDELPSPCVPIDFRELELGRLSCCRFLYRDPFIGAMRETAMSYRRQAADAAARHHWWYVFSERVHHYGGVLGFLLRPIDWYMRRQRDLWRYRAEDLEAQAVRFERKCYEHFAHEMTVAWVDVLRGVAIRMGLDIEIEPVPVIEPGTDGIRLRVSGWSYHVPVFLWDHKEGKA